MATVESWRTSARPEVSIPLLVFIVLGEEVVWRAAVTLPLAAGLGPWTGAVVGAVAFAIAHAGMGVGLLVLLAFPAGLFWNLLLVETGSAVPGLVCHLLFDVAALFVLPY
jgi:membrane protease YdiL (CAAX protease family)